jgi:hypothetical protein
VVTTAVNLLNRSPMRSVEAWTPYEAWHWRKPNVELLHTFGTIVYVKNTRPQLKKLVNKSIKMVFSSYEVGTKGYRAYGPCTGRIHITRDAIFDELVQWDKSKEATVNSDTDPFKFVVTTEQVAGQAKPALVGAAPGRRTPSPSPMPQGPPPIPQATKFVSPLSIEPDLDVDHDEELPMWFCWIDNVLGPVAVLGLVEHTFQEELHAISIEEPSSLQEAAQDPLWHMAMAEELHSI